MECTLIVFGDVGRSPRMQNHALEIVAQTDLKVNLVGYLGKSIPLMSSIENPPYQEIQENNRIRLINIDSKFVNMLKKLPRIFYLLYAILRIIIQIAILSKILIFTLKKQEFVLVQNPPCIPVLSTLYFVRFIKRYKIIVDFHNYGYTILQLNLKNRKIIKLATQYEKFFAKRADYALCVSKAMKNDLLLNWGINAQTVYDKANKKLFKQVNSLEEKHQFYLKMKFQWNTNDKISQDETIFTIREKGKIIYKEDRPLLLISSTSWTQDEDFGILLKALDEYDQCRIQAKRLYVCITGKGPQKEYYRQIIQQKKWEKVKVELLWLETQDYPKLLSVCDFGVCLHYSSSGLDLPMKVVDMFGAGIPVIAKKFKAIDELVIHQQNGLLFDEVMFDELVWMIKMYEEFQKGVQEFNKKSFSDEWKENVQGMIKQKMKVN